MKQLSTNDYTAAEKTKLEALPTNTVLNNNLNLKVDKVAGKALSDKNFTADLESKLGALPTNTTLNDNLNLKADKNFIEC